MCERNLEFISKLMSKCLRAGVSIDEIIETAKSIRPCMSYCNRTRVKGDTSPGISCPSAIGKALEDFKNKISDLMGDDESDENYEEEEIIVSEDEVLNESVIESHDACPQCGSPIVHEGGCVVCHSCGWSKCG